MTLTKASEQQIEKLATQTQEGFLDNLTGAFFRRIDWWAFWIVLAATFAVYFYTLAPTVTLEDGGELAVAADHLGVPHPPGYPIWTLTAWFFQWIFHWVTYNGYPNPSWSVGLASAVSGAGACALLALLVSRSGADLLRSVPELKGKIGFQAENLLCLAAGISGGLLLAFSPVLWSQSVIVEVYSLNALFQMVVLLLIYMWMCRPKSDLLLYVAAFLFGLGLTNHQTLLFLGLALAVAVAMKDADLFRDFAIAALLIGVVFVFSAKGLSLFAKPEMYMELPGADAALWKWSRGPDTPTFWLFNYLFLSIPVALAIGSATKGRSMSIRAVSAVAGVGAIFLLAVWGYAFFASEGAKAAPGFSPWLWNSLVPTEAERAASPFASWLWGPGGPGLRMLMLFRLFILAPFALAFVALPHGKSVSTTILLAQLGVAFYMYLPIASEQNPGMNWGYARTWEGFMHAVTRGQYEAIVPTDIFSEKFIQQLGAYLTDLRQQFSLPVAVLGFLPFCAWGLVFGGRRRSVFPVALGLVLASSALIVLETLTGWAGFEQLYRLLIAPILLMAGWGFFVLVALYLRKQIADLPDYSWGTRFMVGGFLLLVAAAVLWVDVMSLKAVFRSFGVETGQPGFLSGTGKLFYLGLVFGPPVAVAAAWMLSRSALRLGFDLGTSQQRWLIVSVVGFFSVSVVFLIFQNPQLDIQNLFIGRVQFIQSHAFYALWLGYGILLSAAWLERFFGERARMPAMVAGLLLPGILLWQNAYDEDQLRIVGGAEQNGHHYGWQFGHWSLEGIQGVEHDFRHWYPDPEEFERQWGAVPDKDYPPPMTEGAIFYGGTDPGRFVPTYMIYSADCRSDVYLITQNALADNTFMNITRDLYGDTIYIPSLDDSNEAFRKYVDDVQAGRIQAGADIKIEGGKVSVQGVGGVMTINGILAELIFKENKDRHDFYVEESYVIQWMYPYLTPHGLILKLNREPLASLPPELVENDRRFWTWYTPWLLDRPTFRRDICARKSFSKLRSAIAGIYDYRRMYDEAEFAFKQSIELYPLSPEANFRLAQMYMNMQRFEEAETLIRGFLAQDPRNDSARGFLGQIETTRRMIDRRLDIEKRQRETGILSPDEALELVSIYRAAGMQNAYQNLAMRLVSDSGLPPQHLLALAGMFAQDQRIEALAFALEQYTQREAGNVDVWLDLAAAYAFLQREADAIRAARRSIELAGDHAREVILRDQRFQSLANNPEFRALFPRQTGRPAGPVSPQWQGGLPNLPGLAR
jgi:tetratricopeptide (TPR) repeat protein